MCRTNGERDVNSLHAGSNPASAASGINQLTTKQHDRLAYVQLTQVVEVPEKYRLTVNQGNVMSEVITERIAASGLQHGFTNNIGNVHNNAAAYIEGRPVDLEIFERLIKAIKAARRDKEKSSKQLHEAGLHAPDRLKVRANRDCEHYNELIVTFNMACEIVAEGKADIR